MHDVERRSSLRKTKHQYDDDGASVSRLLSIPGGPTSAYSKLDTSGMHRRINGGRCKHPRVALVVGVGVGVGGSVRSGGGVGVGVRSAANAVAVSALDGAAASRSVVGRRGRRR